MKMKFSLAVFAATTAFMTPAMADVSNGYGVGTSAVSGNFFKSTGATSAYRMGVDSSGNYTRITDVVPVQTDNCAARLANVPTDFCVATIGGPTTSSFNLTASNSTASITMNDGNVTTLGNGSALAYADLSTGKMGAAADGTYGFSSLGVAAFQDVLTFYTLGATAATITNIGISYTIDGVLSGAANAFGVADVRSTLGFGGASANLFYQQNQTNPVFAALSQSGWVSGSWDIASSPGLSTFTGIYALSGASQLLNISGFLSVSAGSGAVSNYANTALVRLDLPTGVTYTSASGTFLSSFAAPGAVPEPSTWAMMIVGFGLMGSAMRRRPTNRIAGSA